MVNKEAMKLALEALEKERDNYQDWDKEDGAPEYIYEAITALREALAEQPAHHTEQHLEMVAEQPAQCSPAEDGVCEALDCSNHKPAQQEPDELRHIGEQDCLLDVDEKAWRSLVENRGGCRCHRSPPCGACSNPISEEEMNEVGYTYTSPTAQQEPVAVELVGVEKAIKEGDGFWKSCTGCYETNEGHPPIGAFFSPVFKCHMGHGCSECGGIGAIWDDTDYEEMAEHWLDDDAASQPAQQEPVAIVDGDDHGYFAEILPDRSVKVGQLLYSSPPAQRTWVGLSPADRGKCLSAGDAHGWIGVMEATEARLKELNT